MSVCSSATSMSGHLGANGFSVKADPWSSSQTRLTLLSLAFQGFCDKEDVWTQWHRGAYVVRVPSVDQIHLGYGH